ncbi:MAG: glycosyltransferase family 2 protein [bacterium]
MTFLFWSCVAVMVYAYVGYPFIMWLLSRFSPEPPPPPTDNWPSVSLIIAAFNEENVIEEKLNNALSLGYPRGKREIIVVSDGSTDRTDEIVAGFRTQGVHLIRLERQQGKTAAQNIAVAQAKGDILVFSDANAFYEPNALQWLIWHFSRGDVGCVEGRRVDFTPQRSATARHELAYRDMESHIKAWESRVLSCTGATGPIYAVRRALYIPLDPAMISDFMEPLLIMYYHHKRHIFEPCAISREAVLPDLKDEFARKVRIITRCLTSLRIRPGVLNPFRMGGFAIQIISHRLLRWMIPVFALTGFTANLFLLHHPFYRMTFLLQVSFILVAAIGAMLDQLNIGPALLRLPHYFFAANLAAFEAIINCLQNKNFVTWKTQRPESNPPTHDVYRPSAAATHECT